MKKIIEYDLEYRDNGEKKFKHLEIDFVSNWCLKQFNDFMNCAAQVRDKWDRISDINTEIAASKEKDKIRELKNEEKSCSDFIVAFSEIDIVKHRYDVLKRVLEDNGYREDVEMMNFDWWDNKVDPRDMNELVELCVFKDIKKKMH